MADIKTIREAVVKNRGGFESASDGEIMTLWNLLDETTREKYIESVKTESKSKQKGKPDVTGS
jgi:hypothetical protein